MRILAFDTATAATAVALCDSSAGVTVEARDDPEPPERPGHTTRLMPLIKDVLDRADGGWSSLDRIAVGVGPGTFTGLRIGVATARGLGQALGIPLVGVSTLEAVALNASDDDSHAVLAVLDARRGEVFAAAWRIAGGALGERLLEPQAISPEGLADLLTELPQPLLALGPGAVEFRYQLARASAVIPAETSELHRVTAISHCRLASGAEATSPAEVSPQYLRLPDAEIVRRTTLKR
jgi:tRNA threonylcarbamoyladenosine biosynthesis protein TsaB